LVLSPLVRCQGVFLWVPSEGAVDGTQKAKTELDWDNLPMERWMNDEFQRLLRANEDAQTVISGALRTHWGDAGTAWPRECPVIARWSKANRPAGPPKVRL